MVMTPQMADDSFATHLISARSSRVHSTVSAGNQDCFSPLFSDSLSSALIWS